MAKPNQKLAEALKALKRLQDKHCGVVESGDLSGKQNRNLMQVHLLRFSGCPGRLSLKIRPWNAPILRRYPVLRQAYSQSPSPVFLG